MSPKTKLPRSVWILSWVSFFADVSSEMVYPLLPLFLVDIVGSSKTQLGAMEGIAALIVAFLSGYAGSRSDRTKLLGGRTRWIRWGYGLPVLGKATMALATIWPLVLGGRLLDRLGKGLRGAPRDALISDAVAEDLRGRAFGLHRAFDTAGALLGVLLAAVLLGWLSGTPLLVGSVSNMASNTISQTPAWAYRIVFGVAAFLSLASWGLTFLVKEPEGRDLIPAQGEMTATVDRISTKHVTGMGGLQLPASYWTLLALLVLFSLANSSDTFLLLRVGDLGYTPVAVIMVYALYNVTYAALSYPIGILSDKIGRWRIIACGWLMYAIVYTFLAMLSPEHAWASWPLMALYGVYMALTDGVGKAWIADHAPRERRGTALGLYYAVTGLTTLIASLLVGFVWDFSGPCAALLMGAGFAMASLVALVLLRHRLTTS